MSVGERPASGPGQAARRPGGEWGPPGEGPVRAGGGYNEDSRVGKEVLEAVRRGRGSHGDQEMKTAKVSGEPGPDPEAQSGALRWGQARGRGSRLLEACPPQPVAGS